MIPVCTIKTYTGTTLDHTISADADNINISERLTSAVGLFTFTLKNDKNYEDIALYDKVEFYLGYDSVPASPTFIGRVTKIEGAYDTKMGDIRKISGLSSGEVLLRRLKCGHYSAISAHTIVDEFAADLGLGTGDVGVEANTPEVEFLDQTYFDALQQLSDYWVSGGVQLKKDFYVDTDNDLVWKDRPFRTTGVETFTLGSNILSFNVQRSVENVRNNITVYGDWDTAKTIDMPTDENWTEPNAACQYWTPIAGEGTVERESTTVNNGTYSLKVNSEGSGIFYVGTCWRTLQPDFPFISGNARTIDKSFSEVHFHANSTVLSLANAIFYVLAPDYSNCWYRGISVTNAWGSYTYTLPSTDSAAGFSVIGSPQANYITGFRWYTQGNADYDFWIDGLCIRGGRFCSKASDATSITDYGQRDLVVIEETLKSLDECASRANTLLYQKKDPTVEIDIATYGNTNVLVGDKLDFTLPRESIDDYYYVTNVEHTLDKQGFFTKFTAVEGVSNRFGLPRHITTELAKTRAVIRAMGRGSLTIP